MNHEETPTSAARTRAANPTAPTAEQLAAARTERWHQVGDPLLTVEDARAWLQRSGLVLYGAKPQLGAPAPSLVEATLGKAQATPDAGEQDVAKSLLARLVAEGSAVPLNLLGATGGMGTDQPDFVVSAAVFSYIFTLRGNKAWKQVPATAGAVKVSPLALAVYEVLGAKVTLSSYDLATQLGGGVSEGAVLRALTELWSQLRVLPAPQLDGSTTLWELASGRFTKQIKAGANAGQPSALSALISLYLGQTVAATEDEIESFLSPLAARSRVRDVVHALMGARQLETLVIEGRTLLHVAGELPTFAADSVPVESVAGKVKEQAAGDEGESRIRKFAGKPGNKIGSGLRAKPVSNKAGSRAKPIFGRKVEGERERRPFKSARRSEFPGRRTDSGGGDKPRFDKPWQEKRPARDAGSEAGRPARQAFTPREGDGPRRTFSKPGTFGRKREGMGDRGGFAGRPPMREAGSGGARPGRTDYRPMGSGFKSAGSYTPRPRTGETKPFGTKPKPFGLREGGGPGEAPRKVFRKFDAPRSPKPFGSKPAFGSRPAPKARTADRSATSERSRPGDKAGFTGRKPAFGEKKPVLGAKKPFSKTGGSSFKGAGGPFAKFADGKKPFRKPGPPKKAAGGFAPTKRRRDEDERGGEMQ